VDRAAHVGAHLEAVGHGAVPTHLEGVESGADFARRHAAHASFGDRVFAVPAALAPLLPGGGLERGHVYACRGEASLSLVCCLVADASRHGSWVGLVGVESLGLMCASDAGVALERLVRIDIDEGAPWAHVVGACVEGIDIVVVARPRCTAHDARRIEARVKAHGGVLVVLGDAGAFSAHVVLSSRTVRWDFTTHAARRTVHVRADGRRSRADAVAHMVLPDDARTVAAR